LSARLKKLNNEFPTLSQAQTITTPVQLCSEYTLR
jgi:hypothetical protein